MARAAHVAQQKRVAWGWRANMAEVTTTSPSGDQNLNALLGDYRWSSTAITFSFPSSSTQYGSGYYGSSFSNFEALNATQKTAVREILAMYASVSGLTFTEVTETTTEHATMRFAMSDDARTAYAFLPGTSAEAG